jgi:hypothetical protein
MPGYSPTSGLSTNLPQSAAIFFDKAFVSNLKMLLPFYRCVSRRELPVQSGTVHRLYLYSPGMGIGQAEETSSAFEIGVDEDVPAAQTVFNTSTGNEGTVGTGLVPVVLTDYATIGQFVDYVSVSDFALETVIDDALANLQAELAYRTAGTVSALTRAQFDASSVVDATVAIPKTTGSPVVIQDLIAAIQEMRNRSIMPFEGNKFKVCISPLVVGDVLTSTEHNSLVDIYKHTTEGLDKLEEIPGSTTGDGDVQVLDFSGFTAFETPYVTQTVDYQSGTATALRTYIFGKEGLIGINLGSKSGTQIGVGDWSNLTCWIHRATEPTIADPTRVIGGFTSVNFKMVVTLPPDPVVRLRYIDASSNLS